VTTATAGAGEIAARVQVSVAAEVGVGATVIGVIAFVSGVHLFLAGRYQEQLRDLRFILLEDPLKSVSGAAPAIPAWPKFCEFLP
jgi:hypothetical protein